MVFLDLFCHYFAVVVKTWPLPFKNFIYRKHSSACICRYAAETMVAADCKNIDKTFSWRIRCLPPFGFRAHFLRYDPTAHTLSFSSGKLKLDTEGVRT